MINPTPTDTTPDEQEAMGEVEVKEFKKRSVSGAISYTIRSVFLNAISVVTSGILAYYLSAAEFGIYGIVTQIVSLLQFFSDIGLGYTLIQKKEKPTLREYRTVFTVQQILAFLILLIVVGISMVPSVGAKIGTAGIWVLLALGLSFSLSSLKVIPAIILERKLNFSKLVIPNIFEQIVYNVLLVYLVVSGHGVASYAYAVIARGIVGVIAMYWIQPWKIGLAFDLKIIKKILGTALQFQATDFLARIKDQLFYLALARYLPLEQFGYITWAKSWSQMPYTLTVQNVVSITFPAFSRLQHDKKRLGMAIEKSIFFITIAIFPLLFGMSLFIQPLVAVISRYQKWQPAVWTFVFFTMGIAWSAISTPLTNTLAAIGKINITLKLMLFWTILTWILTPICFWIFGFNGIALAALLISFTSVLPIYLAKKHVHFDVWNNVKLQLLASVVMTAVGLAGMSYWQQDLVKMIVGIMIVGSSYVLALLVFGYKRILAEAKSLRS